MKRWKLTLEYDGGAFCGWQRQAHAPSVQQAIEEAVAGFSAESVTLHVAGRTDAGVHAREQVAHMDLEKEMEGSRLCSAVNFYLRPHKIALLNAQEVAPDFHARFDARGRVYRYRIVNRRPPLVLDKDQAWHVTRLLDVVAMQRAADLLIGHHDFSTFRAADCQANSPHRTLDRLFFTQEGEVLTLQAEARSFLYHQVRNMVGTLALVGANEWTLDNFAAAFAACDRTRGGPTAPPQGLCLWDVRYGIPHHPIS